MFCDDYGDGLDTWQQHKSWIRPGKGDGWLDDAANLKLFGELHPSDLRQGSIGDCWLISSIAALCEFPEAFNDIFETTSLSEEGRYVLKLFCDTDLDFKLIVIDDRLPAYDWMPKPCYAKNTDSGEIWPCLLEKAIAVLRGGYKGICGGIPSKAFAILTGCQDVFTHMKSTNEESDDFNKWCRCSPVWGTDRARLNRWGENDEYYQDGETVFEHCVKWSQLNYLLAAGSPDGSDRDVICGIVQGHAYSILSVQANVGGSEWSMIQLRNPWGKTEWTGRFADDSYFWNKYPEVKEALQPEEGDDGAFWMCKEDFLKHFTEVYTCEKEMPPRRVIKRPKRDRKAAMSILNNLDDRGQSDFMHSVFDEDRTGFLDLVQMQSFSRRVGKEFPAKFWKAVCRRAGADPRKGLTKDNFYSMFAQGHGADGIEKHFKSISAALRSRCSFLFEWGDKDKDDRLSQEECMGLSEASGGKAELFEERWTEICEFLSWNPETGPDNSEFVELYARFMPSKAKKNVEALKLKDGGEGIREVIRDTFEQFDMDGDGTLDVVELKDFLSTIDAVTWTDERLEQLMKVVDKNEDQRICFAEFISWSMGDPHKAEADAEGAV